MRDKIIDRVVDRIIDAYDGVSGVQKRFGYTEPMGVYNWRSRGIPKSLIAEIYVDTNIPIRTLQSACRATR